MSAAHLFQLIASLFAALFAPARLLARVAGMDARRMRGLAQYLRLMQTSGRALAYPGEDDATVAKRIAFATWISDDPLAALKYLVRRLRGVARARSGNVAPPDGAPPILFCRPLRDVAEAPACDDSS